MWQSTLQIPFLLSSLHGLIYISIMGSADHTLYWKRQNASQHPASRADLVGSMWRGPCDEHLSFVQDWWVGLRPWGATQQRTEGDMRVDFSTGLHRRNNW